MFPKFSMAYTIRGSELFLVLCAVLLALWQLFAHGYPITHSTIFNLNWVFQFSQQFLAGQWYPRWLEQSFMGMGSPTFTFYPPMCMFATLPFVALGWSVSESAVGSMVLATLIGGSGSYFYSTRIFREAKNVHFIAAIVASLTVLSPYFLENIYVRGAMGEVWAMAWLPWVLWASSANLHACKVWPLYSLFYCFFSLSHPPTLLNVTLLFGLALLLAKVHRQLTFTEYITRLYIPMALGLGLASLYLFPAIFDQKLINIDFLGVFTPLDRFMVTGLTQLKPQWTTRYEARLIPFMVVSIVTGIIAVLVFCKYVRTLTDEFRQQYWLWLFFLSISLFMMTDLARIIYRSIPVLKKIQFSWRWMSVVGVVLPLLWGAVIVAVSAGSNRWIKMGIWIVTPVWIVFPFVTNLQNTEFQEDRIVLADLLFASQSPFPSEIDVTLLEDRKVPISLERTASGKIFLSDAHEYIPKEVSFPKILSPASLNTI